MPRNYIKMADDALKSVPGYHEKAQEFIKSSHLQGRNVTAEDGELIAHKSGTFKFPKVPSLANISPKIKPLLKVKQASLSQPEQMRRTLNKIKKTGKYSNGKGVGI